jgi:hypothetical protein
MTSIASFRFDGLEFLRAAQRSIRTALGFLEISYLGNEDGVIDKHGKRGRRYSVEEKAAAVRMVRTLRAELGTNQGHCSVWQRSWVMGSSLCGPG